MGNSASAPSDSAVEFLAKISGNEPVTLLHTDAWENFFKLNDTPLATLDPTAVEDALRPYIASLVYHNAQTLNCQRLLHLLCRQLLKQDPQTATIGVANAVCIARTILKDLIEQLNSAQLLSFVEVPSEVLAGEFGEAVHSEFKELEICGSLVSSLAQAALDSLKALPSTPSPQEYLFQLEVVQLLMVLASTQLFTSPSTANTPARNHVFLEALVGQRSLIGLAVEVLIKHFVANCPPPQGLNMFTPSPTRTTLTYVRSAASSVLYLPYATYSLLRSAPSTSYEASPLATAALGFLLVMYFYAPVGAPGSNLFRQALQQLRDTEDISSVTSMESGRGLTTSGANVPYAGLYDALGKALANQESSVLLLYILIHGNSQFNQYCMARSDIDCIILPILQLLYSIRGRSANQLYMLLIVLLILSEDAAFAGSVHQVKLRSVPFYKERPLVQTTLGSLLIVLLLRTAHYNLAATRDLYLHTNTLATLANLAPHMSDLSAHAAQNLVHQLRLLHKRRNRLVTKASDEPTKGTQPFANEEDADGKERIALELQLYSDFLRIVLEIINAILVNALSSNPELVYALLHDREVFEPFHSDPRYADLMENIVSVIEYFGHKIDEAMPAGGTGQLSAEEVLAIIKLNSRGWRKGKLKASPELRFTYEEEVSPGEFFVPYVWSLVVASGRIPWSASSIAGFSPDGAIEVVSTMNKDGKRVG